MPWQWLSTTGTWVRSTTSIRHLRIASRPTRGGGDEGYRLGAGDRPHCFPGRQEPRMVERYVLGTRGTLEPHEQHERRQSQAVEAEVVGPAGPHRRAQFEAGFGQ